MLIDSVVIIAFLIYGFIGFTRGFINSILDMVKSSTSVIIAIVLCRPIASFLNNTFGLAKTCSSIFSTSQKEGELILIAVVIILIFITTRLILRLFNSLATKARENKVINKADSIFGFLFGLLRFCFTFCILSTIVYIITMLPFTDGIYTWLFKNSSVALWLYNTTTDIIFTRILGAFTQMIGL